MCFIYAHYTTPKKLETIFLFTFTEFFKLKFFYSFYKFYLLQSLLKKVDFHIFTLLFFCSKIYKSFSERLERDLNLEAYFRPDLYPSFFFLFFSVYFIIRDKMNLENKSKSINQTIEVLLLNICLKERKKIWIDFKFLIITRLLSVIYTNIISISFAF